MQGFVSLILEIPGRAITTKFNVNHYGDVISMTPQIKLLIAQ